MLKIPFELAIRLYQRFISPHKGYCCKMHHSTGGRRVSCSEFAIRVMHRTRCYKWLPLMRRRFERCKRAAPMRSNRMRTSHQSVVAGAAIQLVALLWKFIARIDRSPPSRRYVTLYSGGAGCEQEGQKMCQESQGDDCCGKSDSDGDAVDDDGLSGQF